jgi:hypothetical protein
MPHGGNFNPEWGYLAPRPGFIRTLRAVLVAGAIGTVAGMAVAVALVARPAADVSVAARTMAQPNVSEPSLKNAAQKSASAFNAEVLQNSARDVAPPPLPAASASVDDRDFKDLAAAETRSAATMQQHTSVAALAEAPAVSDNTANMLGGAMRPSPPTKVSRVQRPAGAAVLAEAPAWRDDASEMSSEAVPVPSPKRVNRKAQVARLHTPRNDRNFRERQGGPLDFFPMIGRTILGANPFWND